MKKKKPDCIAEKNTLSKSVIHTKIPRNKNAVITGYGLIICIHLLKTETFQFKTTQEIRHRHSLLTR